MGRGPHKSRKNQMKVKSVRFSENEMETISIFEDAEEVSQSEAIRLLIHYGILYYTMNIIEPGE
jgi:hypothetical protein